MSTPILATKLYIPPPRPNLVLRPRLIERLNEGLSQNLGFGRKLTLISAPAGFGKTTLVSDWLYQSKVSAAWLSLDEKDNDPTRFLAYLIAALQTIDTDIGARALSLLQSPQPPPIESILTGLLNEIATIPDNFVLVLDDYQALLTQYQMVGSMSRKGNCYDNAPMESFFGTFKVELIFDRDYTTRNEARLDIFEYIEVFYNRFRRHSALGYKSPAHYEALPLVA